MRSPVARISLRRATIEEMDLPVRQRRGMREAIGGFSKRDLDDADRAYRLWARGRLRAGTLVGFIVETLHGEPIASGCVWAMPVQPRPHAAGTRAAYLMSMFTKPAHRGRGYATRIVGESLRWARRQGFDLVLLHYSDQGRRIYEDAGFTPSREMRMRLRR